MMRSLSSGVAGLRTHQTKMDVIGNNIANVNTYGFKTSRVTFSDIYYQNLSSGSSPGTMGGTNPSQIGYGSAVASIDVLNNVAGASRTDRPMDVYITGEGYLVTQDANGNYMYTRMGALGFDAAGNLIDVNGNFVMGFPQNRDGTPNIPSNGRADGDSLVPIAIDPDILDDITGISIGTNGEITALLPGDVKVTLGTASPAFFTAMSASPDSDLTGPVSMKIGYLPSFSATGAGSLYDTFNNWTGLSLAASDINVKFGDVPIAYDASTMPFTLEVIANNQVKITYYEAYHDNDGNLVYDGPKNSTAKFEDGKLVFKQSSNELLTIEFADTVTSLPLDSSPPSAATSLTMQQYYEVAVKDKGGNVHNSTSSNNNVPMTYPPTPNTSISLEDLTITLDTTNQNSHYFNGTLGRISSDDSEMITIGNLVLAKFPNAAALEQIGNTNYLRSLNTGDPIFIMPGLDGTGDLMANMLEMSNVDISNEFTEMITTQRGFQANTRIITVSDEMLQELVNLKR